MRDAAYIESRSERSESGCWLWMRCVNRGGYGQAKVNNRVVSAHRLAYEILVGPIPSGLCVLHECAKITEDQVRVILGSGEARRVLAERYGVTRRMIGYIKTGRRWTHIKRITT